MTSPPDVGKVKAQVDSGNIEWDVILTDLPAIPYSDGGRERLSEELDYSKIDPKILAQVIPERREDTPGGENLLLQHRL